LANELSSTPRAGGIPLELEELKAEIEKPYRNEEPDFSRITALMGAVRQNNGNPYKPSTAANKVAQLRAAYNRSIKDPKSAFEYQGLIDTLNANTNLGFLNSEGGGGVV